MSGESVKTWAESSAADVLADFNAVLSETWAVTGPPDRIVMPFSTFWMLKRWYVRGWVNKRKPNKRRPGFAQGWRH